MYRLFPLAIILQIFCLYHAYRNKPEQYWYWIILFFPFVGSVFYLYDNFYSKKNIDNLVEDVKGKLVTNYKIEKLERELAYTKTYSNVLRLIDEHGNVGNYGQALDLCLSNNEGIYKNDPDLLMKIIRYSFLTEDYQKVVTYGKILKYDKLFMHSQEHTAFAWSYYYTGDTATAEKEFTLMDIKFTNYDNRMEYISFLMEIGKTEQAKMKVEELLMEIESMDRYEQRLKKDIHKKLKTLSRNL